MSRLLAPLTAALTLLVAAPAGATLTFAPPRSLPGVGAPVVSLRAADLDGDGRQDFVAGDGGGRVTRGLGTADGGFATTTLAVGSSDARLALGQFNADGRPDAVVSDPGANRIWILLND